MTDLDPITIDDLHRGDLPSLTWSGSATHLENVARQLDRRDAGAVDYLVARDSNNMPVAKCGIDYEESPGAGIIFQLATRADLEGRGLATQLIAAAERRIITRGLSLARLSVEPDNKRAVRLYQHLGYRKVGERDTSWQHELPDGTRALYRTRVSDMEKHLLPTSDV